MTRRSFLRLASGALVSSAGDVAIALIHEPDYFSTMVQLTPVDLQLCGHSHGGQIRIPGFGPLILPEWGQVYHTGLYELDGRTVYTGRGLGLVELPLRFACPPELTEITLTQRETAGPAVAAGTLLGSESDLALRTSSI